MRAGNPQQRYVSAWFGVQICVMCVCESSVRLISVCDTLIDKDLWPNSDCNTLSY